MTAYRVVWLDGCAYGLPVDPKPTLRDRLRSWFLS